MITWHVKGKLLQLLSLAIATQLRVSVFWLLSAAVTTSIIPSSNIIQNGDVLVPAYPGCPGKKGSWTSVVVSVSANGMWPVVIICTLQCSFTGLQNCTRPFDVVYSLVTNAQTRPHVKWDFCGPWEQFWPNSLPVANLPPTTDNVWQQDCNPFTGNNPAL